MKWLLVILFMNVQPHGWEVYGQEFKDLKSCREAALEINEKMDNANAEANRLNILQIEQIYAWCEKN
jgi:hypothetical protein